MKINWRRPDVYTLRRNLWGLAVIVFMATHCAAAVIPNPTTPLRVVADDNYPPYVFVNGNGQVVGYEVDLWKLWEKKTGLKVDFIATNRVHAQAMMRDGKADVIDLIYRTPQRLNLYDFSKPFATTKVAIFSSQSISGIANINALKGFKVGVERGDACAEYLRSDSVTDLRLFNDYHDLIAAAASGNIKLFCMDEGPAYYYLSQKSDHLHFKKDFTFYQGHLRRAVRKNDAPILKLISHGMALITPAERSALKNKWLGRPIKFATYARAFVWTLLALFALALLTLFWVRALRAAVTRKTRELREANAQLRTLVDSSPDLIWLKDPNGVYLACNPKAARMIGRTTTDVIGKTDDDLRPSNSVQNILQLDREVLQTSKPRTDEGTVTANGQTCILETIKTPVLDQTGTITGVLSIARDITERKHAEEQLQQAAKVFESTRDAILVTDANRSIVMVNSAFMRITGYEAKEVLGNNPAILEKPDKRNGEFDSIWSQKGSSPDTWRGEVWCRRKSGRPYLAWWTINTARNPDQAITHYVATFFNTSETRQYESRIRFLTRHDALTRLPNQIHFMESLNEAIKDTNEIDGGIALIFMRIDNLRAVNASLGHPSGDALLVSSARRLRRAIGRTHTLGCIRGNVFSILLKLKHGDCESEIASVADRAFKALSAPMPIDDRRIPIRVSAGVAIYPKDGADVITLMRNVDTALHKARRQTGQRLCFYNDDLGKAAQRDQLLHEHLRNALDRDEFELHYQPRYQVDSGVLAGAEALIRWRTAEGKLISPGEFIPFAEESDLIVPIGQWVLRTACEQWSKWHASGMGDLPIAVNVTGSQLNHPDFLSHLESAFQSSRLPPQLLELEITEGEILNKTEDLSRLLDKIRGMGISLAIDDFGTGYSSFAYLRHFPASLLKIDKSFIDDIPDSPEATRIVGAIVSMAHTLRMKVIAEGVETKSQADILSKLKCDQRQGHYDAHPMSAQDFDRLLRSKDLT